MIRQHKEVYDGKQLQNNSSRALEYYQQKLGMQRTLNTTIINVNMAMKS